MTIESKLGTLKAIGDDSLGRLLRKFEEGTETVFDIAEDAEGSKRVVFERRELQPEAPDLPPEARSDRPNHTFHTVESVVAYLEEYGNEKTVIVADAEAGRATIALDENKAFGGVDQLYFEPALHPVFKMWSDYFRRPHEVLEFAQFALENRRQIVQPEGKELVYAMSQVKVSKHFEIARGRGPKQINGIMVTTEISGQKTETPLDLPEMIAIRTPVFLTGDTVDIEFDLLVYESNDSILVKGSNPDIAAQLADQFINNIQEIEAQLTDPIVTFGHAQRRKVQELYNTD